MTDNQPEALRQAAWLKKEGASCQRHYDLGVLIERQHTELETLRTGYAAARLEIESLRKEHADELTVAYMCGANWEKELAAQQPGASRQAPASSAVLKAIREANLQLVRTDDDAFMLVTLKQPAPQQGVSAAGGDSFLLLPTRPAPDAPANTAGLSWNAYSGAQMLAYGRACSDAALVVAAPQLSPAAQGDALSDDAVRVPLDSLHADAAYLIGRLREGSMPYARVIEIIRERIDAAKAAIRARAAQEGK